MDHESYRQVHQSAAAAESYASEVYSPGTWDSWLWDHEKRVLDRIWAIHGLDRSVHLDFACGSGRVLQWAESRTSRSVGVDVSGSMLSQARAQGTRSRLIEADLTTSTVTLPGPFDVVTAFRFFLNAEPSLREDAMEALRRRIRPEGLLIANNHLSARSMHRLVQALPRKRSPSPMRDDELTDLASRHAFELVGQYGVGLVSRGAFRILRMPVANLAERMSQRIEPLSRQAVTKIMVFKAEV